MTPSELRSRRHKLGLSQAQLAGKLGVAPNTVARWERGEIAIVRGPMLRIVLDHLADQQGAVAEQLEV